MSQHQSINQLRKGETATIVGYLADEIPIKIYEMGLLPGVVLTLKRQAPFNGPVCIHIRDNPNAIALRRSEAALILIETLS
ncbi:ferrous iron transport protein A [Parapedobacter sp. ISTM3]|uniref:Ferrous iron transport protein A n=1 Tax=Parapedobacter luteus TaxID=623280 RepID=A0A1T4ZX83_9SPHI|nr:MULTISPECIES: FeoA family protein [Parapedobacter]MBK1438755.1 ferrous iron transport protein A [Parapedobacter sp. ISTM3]SKB27328.1 ferrous iron transport protein A [Parapedobacter luteus]